MSTDRNNGTATPREDSEREEGIVEVSGGLEDETEDEGGCGVGWFVGEGEEGEVAWFVALRAERVSTPSYELQGKMERTGGMRFA